MIADREPIRRVTAQGPVPDTGTLVDRNHALGGIITEIREKAMTEVAGMELEMRVNTWNSLVGEDQRKKPGTPLGVPEERKLAFTLARKDPAFIQARDELIAAHMDSVKRIARKFAHSEEGRKELTAVGYEGLVKGIEHFDPEKGTLFTQVQQWVAGSILNELRDNRPLSGTRGIDDAGKAYRKVEDDLMQALQRTVTPGEIAAAIPERDGRSVSAKDVQMALAGLSVDSYSVDNPADFRMSADSNTLPFADPSVDVEGSVVRAIASASLHAALTELPEKHQEILRLRFRDGMTRTEIGERTGYSQNHISRLFRESLGQLRSSIMNDNEFSMPERGEPIVGGELRQYLQSLSPAVSVQLEEYRELRGARRAKGEYRAVAGEMELRCGLVRKMKEDDLPIKFIARVLGILPRSVHHDLHAIQRAAKADPDFQNVVFQLTPVQPQEQTLVIPELQPPSEAWGRDEFADRER